MSRIVLSIVTKRGCKLCDLFSNETQPRVVDISTRLGIPILYYYIEDGLTPTRLLQHVQSDELPSLLLHNDNDTWPYSGFQLYVDRITQWMKDVVSESSNISPSNNNNLNIVLVQPALQVSLTPMSMH